MATLSPGYSSASIIISVFKHVLQRPHKVTRLKYCKNCLKLIRTRLVKMVTGKPVNRFLTGNRFSERITGYQIYLASRRHDPGNADGGVWPLSECTRMSAYPHCAAVSAVARHFLLIPALSAASGHPVWRLVGCRSAPFTSAALIHGQSSEWK